jgi:hypothetical protein
LLIVDLAMNDSPIPVPQSTISNHPSAIHLAVKSIAD